MRIEMPSEKTGLVAQASRLRVQAPSRCVFQILAARDQNKLLGGRFRAGRHNPQARSRRRNALARQAPAPPLPTSPALIRPCSGLLRAAPAYSGLLRATPAYSG